MTIGAGKKKKRESFEPGLRRNAVSTFGNPATTVRQTDGDDNFNSYVQNLLVFIFQTDRQTDRRTDGQTDRRTD